MWVTLCTNHASLKRTRKLISPSAKIRTRQKNANNVGPAGASVVRYYEKAEYVFTT